ncbi:MAG TPA: serine/threonine-protein kinase [Acidobacteriota bacterium]|nr:serine/threonine-protein kinase [Acidobacteriota bacterium]
MAQSYGKWQVVKSLAEGGQTHVFLVRDESAQHEGDFVLKRLKNEARLGRFKNEIEARQKLDHNRIPKVVDSDVESKKPYLVEEYVNGITLRKARDEFKDDPVRTLEYFIQICEVIRFAHSQKVIHRDIKPDNILYRKSDDTMHVTDFGICYILDQEGDERLTQLHEQVGPRGFTAPELEAGRGAEVTPACDVYSLGKLLYWLLTGNVVFREEHRGDRWELTKVHGAQMLRVHKLLDKMLVKEADARSSALGPLIKQAQRAISLMARNVNPISGDAPQLCMYCGIGHLEWGASWYPDKEKSTGGAYRDVKAEFDEFGIELPPNEERIWHVGLCNYCGNVQLFIRNANNRVWEERTHPEPEY